MLKTHGKEAPMRTIPRTTRRKKIDRRRRRKQRQRRRRQWRSRQRPVRPRCLPRRLLKQIGDWLGMLTSAFTRPTGQRFAVLLFAAILTTGSRTILNLLRTADV